MFDTLNLTYFGRPRVGHTIKTFIAFQTADPEICIILIFCKKVWDWLLHHTLSMIFKKSISHVKLYSFIVCLPLLLVILGNMCILTICCLVCDVINFEINLSFFIKPFSYMIKKVGTKI